jgi:hypothetical protein
MAAYLVAVLPVPLLFKLLPSLLPRLLLLLTSCWLVTTRHRQSKMQLTISSNPPFLGNNKITESLLEEEQQQEGKEN